MDLGFTHLLVFGIFMSVLIVFFDGFRGINRYLAGFLLLSCFTMFLKFAFLFSEHIELQAFFSGSFWSTAYLIGPMAFFYVRGMLLDSKTIKHWDYLHFLPFLLICFGSLPFTLGSTFEEKKEVIRILLDRPFQEYKELRINKLIPSHLNELLRGIHGFTYSLGVIGLLVKHRSKLFDQRVQTVHHKIIRNWLCLFTLIFLVLALLHLIGTYIFFKYLDKHILIDFTYYHRAIFAFCFLVMLVSLAFFPSILYGLPKPHVAIQADIPVPLPVFYDENHVGHSNIPDRREDSLPNLLTAEYIGTIRDALAQWVDEKKFVDQEITLSVLSDSIGIPRHHLSYYFNFVEKQTYINWRNQIRIAYACDLMKSEAAQKLTLEGISRACGFSSYVTFFRVFKEIIGISPSDFLAGLTE